MARLLQRITHWPFRTGHLLHLSERIPALDLLAWLQANPEGARTFWQNRERTLAIAGLGVAVELTAQSGHEYGRLLERCYSILGDRDTMFLGGLSFDGRSGHDEWAAFPGASLVLPAIACVQRHGEYRLSVHLWAESRQEFIRRKTQLIAALSRLRFRDRVGTDPSPARVTSRHDDLDFAGCQRHIQAVLNEIASGKLHKAVLARRVELGLAAPLAPFEVLRRWRDVNPGSFCFAMERGPDLFMGCSPERLYRRCHREFRTESLAGTVRIGQTREEDAALEARLHRDPKLVQEHDLVTRFVRGQIDPWVTDVDSPVQAGVFKLDRIQHRHLPIRATLKPGVFDPPLLDALHPTPAVCGFPRGAAQALIHREETAQRGWYSGAVGVVSPQESEFTVAIRSVLLNHQRILCYSGVGIVAGSDPDEEWNELEAKIESFLSVLEC
ncbi:isochorismate synthase [Thioalkalivibrio paradoxus]|uniref:isochorismate synthase n=1 Tax=Thioalkalivibrio paradoxus ARh 1 TaxID=713585 RepID=W0DMR3_9GAMM|nr:isochorismate synthase [Thioalkalivibrio paradoxus]AHE98278.1 isochorismate synthase [Thioalkalivibrio paradoxus ARh 1]